MIAYLRSLSISLLFISSLNGHSWMVLPTEYTEFSGPYGFLFDAQDHPHIIIGNWRNSNRHEFMLKQNDDQQKDPAEKPVFSLYHAVRQSNNWNLQPINWDLEQTIDYSLTGSDTGDNLWLVRFTETGFLEALQWNGSSWLNVSPSFSTEITLKVTPSDTYPPFKLTTTRGNNCAWILITNTMTGEIHFYQLDKNGFSTPLPSYSPQPQRKEKDPTTFTSQCYLGLKDIYPRFILQQHFSHIDQNPILIGNFDGTEWVTESLKVESSLWEGFIETRISDKKVHAASNVTSKGLCYFHQTREGSWSKQILDSTAWGDCDLELDPDENLWILYGSNQGGIREYPIALAHKTDGVWQFEDVAPSSKNMDLVFSQQGKPSIAYSDLTGVYFSEYKQGQWHRKLIAGSGEGGGEATDIEIGLDGTLGILVSAKEGLFYLKKKDNHWENKLVSPLGMGGSFDDYYNIYDNNTSEKIYFWELHGGLWQYTMALISPEGIVKHPIPVTKNGPIFWLFNNPHPDFYQLRGLAKNTKGWSSLDRYFSPELFQLKKLLPDFLDSNSNIEIGAYQDYARTLAVVAQHGKEYYDSSTIWVAFENDGDPESNEYNGNYSMHFEQLDTSGKFKAATISSYGKEGWQVIISCGDGFLYQFTKADFDQPTIKKIIGAAKDVAQIYEFDAGYLVETNNLITSKRTLTYWFDSDGEWVKEHIFTSITSDMTPVAEVYQRDAKNPMAPPVLVVAFYDNSRNVSILATRSPEGIWTLEDIPTRLP